MAVLLTRRKGSCWHADRYNATAPPHHNVSALDLYALSSGADLETLMGLEAHAVLALVGMEPHTVLQTHHVEEWGKSL